MYARFARRAKHVIFPYSSGLLRRPSEYAWLSSALLRIPHPVILCIFFHRNNIYNSFHYNFLLQIHTHNTNDDLQFHYNYE